MKPCQPSHTFPENPCNGVRIAKGNGTNSGRKNQPNVAYQVESSAGDYQCVRNTSMLVCSADFLRPRVFTSYLGAKSQSSHQALAWTECSPPGCHWQGKFNPVSDLWSQQFVISDTQERSVFPVYIRSQGAEDARKRIRAVLRKHTGTF